MSLQWHTLYKGLKSLKSQFLKQFFFSILSTEIFFFYVTKQRYTD